jgi:hypothetical protein
MSNNNKDAAKQQKILPRWDSFPEMPRWQREMERMFGDFSGEKLPTSSGETNSEAQRHTNDALARRKIRQVETKVK